MRNQNPERCSNLPKGTQPAPDSTPGASILERPLHRFLLSAAAPRGAWCRHAPHLGPRCGPRPGEAPAPWPLERPGPSSLLQVFQKRFNGSVSFFRGWNDYKLGFGRADGEYWLGLQNLHLLTLKQKYELRVDLEDFENNTAFAKYTDFSISPNAVSAEEDGYSLHVSGFEDGGAAARSSPPSTGTRTSSCRTARPSRRAPSGSAAATSPTSTASTSAAPTSPTPTASTGPSGRASTTPSSALR
ncbi:microfibril-associated glycoprotein 4 isoform X3 [Monodon monoceros]|uniref:microfibril-associated glycoprotein 4 isoform X3 n=1 Tax=Monodon monoceros TaxID=40151 RepID=UPI0010F9B5AF|nr:microfibril-associated glycoprotein 4 isoform X3 [Monodon monoceros]